MPEILTENKVKELIEKYLNEKLDIIIKKYSNEHKLPDKLSLIERIIRVEEELKAQRDLMEKSFELVEKRFEQIDKNFDLVEKRFEQIDKRFEQIDKRFDLVDKRIDELRDYTDKRFKLLTQIIISINIPILIGIIGLLIKSFL